MAKHVLLDQDVYKLHGPEDCARTCSVCDGKHHWMADCPSEDDDPADVVDPEAYFAQEMVYDCKHCGSWLEYIGPDGEVDVVPDYEA